MDDLINVYRRYAENLQNAIDDPESTVTADQEMPHSGGLTVAQEIERIEKQIARMEKEQADG